MGKTIEKIVQEEAKHEILHKIRSQNLSDFNNELLHRADVVIDFSVPEKAFDNISICLNAGTSVVSGTTGWVDRLDELKQLADDSETGFIYASNFSIGVNLFFHLNKKLAEMMKDHSSYKAFMEEIHHKEKLDSPSGTAISLAEAIINSSSKKHWVNEHSIDPDALPIISKRIEDIAGVHEVKWKSEIDEIEIKHTAKSREGFARGALLAAEWLIDKKGFHSMDEVLNLL